MLVANYGARMISSGDECRLYKPVGALWPSCSIQPCARVDDARMVASGLHSSKPRHLIEGVFPLCNLFPLPILRKGGATRIRQLNTYLTEGGTQIQLPAALQICLLSPLPSRTP